LSLSLGRLARLAHRDGGLNVELAEPRVLVLGPARGSDLPIDPAVDVHNNRDSGIRTAGSTTLLSAAAIFPYCSMAAASFPDPSFVIAAALSYIGPVVWLPQIWGRQYRRWW
jgi:hypothetical protein